MANYKLTINVADLTKIPPIIAQIMLGDLQRGIPYCKGKKIDECYVDFITTEERGTALKEILKAKNIRVEGKIID